MAEAAGSPQRPHLADPGSRSGASPPQGRGSWTTCLMSQLSPSFSARPPRNEICREDVGQLVPAGHRPAPNTMARLSLQPSQWVTWNQPGAPHLREGGGVEGTAKHGDERVQPPSVGWGPWGAVEGLGARGDRLTHRVQLPLEYDEGHEADDDKYRAEAQVGEEVAREVTWARREKGVRTEHEHQ